MQTCRRGPKGQALLLRDVHAALLRVLDSADDELMAAPAAALEVAPQELGPHDAFRCAATARKGLCLDPGPVLSCWSRLTA